MKNSNHSSQNLSISGEVPPNLALLENGEADSSDEEKSYRKSLRRRDQMEQAERIAIKETREKMEQVEKIKTSFKIISILICLFLFKI